MSTVYWETWSVSGWREWTVDFSSEQSLTQDLGPLIRDDWEVSVSDLPTGGPEVGSSYDPPREPIVGEFLGWVLGRRRLQ